MEQRRYYILNEDDFNSMQWQLREAIHYCEQAVPFRLDEDMEHTYPAATGYSQSAMQGVQRILNTLVKTVQYD